MGQSSGKLSDTFFGKTEIAVLMLGLDAAGKTSVLNKLLVGELLPTHPTIYVVDSQDRERFSETKEAFQKGAMTPMEVCEGLGLCDVKDRKWHVKGTCAPTGDGIFEGLNWLSSTLKVLKANDDSSLGSSNS